MSVSWCERAARGAATSKHRDPWHGKLSGLQGRIHDDGVERITCQMVWDVLGLSYRERNSAHIKRRLAKIMVELGWTQTRLWSVGKTLTGKSLLRGYRRTDLTEGPERVRAA